jgi:hypothetical protein
MSKATDMLTTMGGLRGPAAAPKGTTVGLLRGMATGSDYKERKHDIILTASADEIERLRAQRDELLAALEDMTDTHELLYHPRDRHRMASHIGRIANARAAIAKAKEPRSSHEHRGT